MGVPRACSVCWLSHALVLVCTVCPILYAGSVTAQTAQLSVDASPQSAQTIPGNMFGIFFEELNHAGAGGLWAELVSNRGFEAGGPNTPSNIDPWLIIGDESSITVATDRSSCFAGNPVALRMEVLCDATGTNACPSGGVGIYNPGYWGMGHGFRKDLASLLADLKPRFLKFPGGNYVMGNYLSNAFRWSETVGPWEERPGHFNDVWGYWTDDGLGFFEFLQLAEDLGACPVWVVNDGGSIYEEIPSATVASFVKDVVDGIEFARGDNQTAWGSVRVAMGHPEPFPLYYVAIGNQECSKRYYKEKYVKFYSAIKASYPDIKIISSCDISAISPSNPADLYDVHVYTSSGDMFSKSRMFDSTARNGPKAIVSEYAVTGNDAGRGTLLAALAEAAFLIGLERNSDVVEMASCAPLFVNDNDRSVPSSLVVDGMLIISSLKVHFLINRWNPDAIVFNSWQYYGCPNYWMLHFFKDSSGAMLHPSTIQLSNYDQLVTSAITWKNPQNGNTYLKIKVVNFGNKAVSLSIYVTGLETGIQTFGSIKTVLTSGWLRDENSFQQPDKVVPVASPITNAREQMSAVLDSYSLTSFDLLLDSSQTMHSVAV
ncbi:hypothetical protein PR202_gb19700 [Eleusine coracana subsp. coracana]|uniref:non-reducing end alpha-L-arabinofuranosidase n=1 Tax=Eleusine coracana subsp. coracana TaxID=191504 RepID=A0AAV5FAC7_ELECO|nr:hypothetical protein PR202_gb19700 [Eleusine coracana subsp. coracana]